MLSAPNGQHDLSRRGGTLQQITKLLNRQTCILHDPAHGEGFDGIVPRDGDLAITITHDDVLALPDDHKPSLLQGANRVQVTDAGKFRHTYTGTSSSRTSASRKRSSSAARYSRMAS